MVKDQTDPDEVTQNADAFVRGLGASIGLERARLEAALAEGGVEAPGTRGDVSGKLDDLNDEVSELRSRLAAVQANLDALLGGDPDVE